jgi:Tol biopolymer transport system component
MLPVDGPFNALRQPSFRPDGTSLLYVSVTQSTTELRAFEFATGLVEVYIPDKFAALQFPQWSPDGTRVVVRAKVTNEDDWTHWIWDSRDDSLVEIVADDVEESIVSALSWSCDGESFFHVRGTGGFGGITDVWEMATDGSQGGQLTFGMIPSTISIRVSPDCDEVLIDSLSEGRSLRVGTLSEPPSGSLARGFTSPLSAEDSYANCDYLVGSRYVCERLSGPGAEFDSCDEGSSQCVLDIVVLDSSGEATNITRSLEIRETFPVASRLAADFQP